MYGELGETISGDGALLLGILVLYVVVVFNIGAAFIKRGHALLGRRLQSISILSVGYMFFGFLIAGALIVYVMGGYDAPMALLVDGVGKAGGFMLGCYYGWSRPLAD